MSTTFNRHKRRRPSVNITPLIDVMFLLIIFFTVSSSFRDQIGIDLTLPEAATATTQESPPSEIIVDKAGAIYFGGKVVTDQELTSLLEALVTAQPGAPIVLRAYETADWGRVLHAMDIARQVGGSELIMPTASHSGAPGAKSR